MQLSDPEEDSVAPSARSLNVVIVPVSVVLIKHIRDNASDATGCPFSSARKLEC